MLEHYLMSKELATILADMTIDQNIREEHSSHDDGSTHDFDLVITVDGFIEKCILCGVVKGKEATS